MKVLLILILWAILLAISAPVAVLVLVRGRWIEGQYEQKN